jgi:LmbE family N-acetylglucosaminyl deacetylase
MPTLRTLGRVVAVSPHLDDAVFSCGQLLAAHLDSTVVTVFAGTPPEDAPLTKWDARCGFASAAEAVSLRREEDRIGLSLLEARPVWLDFIDSQYGASPPPDEVGAALQQVLLELGADSVLFPLGLFHSDHALVHQAVTHIVPTLPDVRWLMYEDALYRGLPGLVQQRLMALAQAGMCVTPLRLAEDGSATLKARAVQSYASQLRAFGDGGHDDLAAPERCWLLEPGEGGFDGG